MVTHKNALTPKTDLLSRCYILIDNFISFRIIYICCESIYTRSVETKQMESKMIYLLLLVTFAPFIVLGFVALEMVCDNYNHKNKVSVESFNKTYNMESI